MPNNDTAIEPMTITHLTDVQVSDLFFNFEHRHLDAYFAECNRPVRRDDPDDFGSITSDEGQAALRRDAAFFADIVGEQVTAEQLVADFMRRV
jgi:hypothetical protein